MGRQWTCQRFRGRNRADEDSASRRLEHSSQARDGVTGSASALFGSDRGRDPAVALDGGTRYKTRVMVGLLTIWTSVGVPILAAAAAATGERPPTPTLFAPVSTPAFAIREVSLFVLGVTAVIFVIVGGLGVYAIVRYRRRPGDSDREPPQVYGSTQIEL